jgi:hypothetical protein
MLAIGEIVADGGLNIRFFHIRNYTARYAMSGLSKDAIDLTNEKWEDVERYNACLARLIARRKREIALEGILVESKTAWKLATLQQSLLYRACAVANGTADAWNANNVTSAVILGRAVIETIALIEFVRDELLRLREPMNIAAANAIDAVCNEQLFSTRSETALAGGYGHLARNVLTYIDKFDKKSAGAREAYDSLSEFAHPNSNGHYFTYGELDKGNGRVTFHESAPRIRGSQVYIVTCLMLMGFVERAMDTFDETIPIVGEVDKGQGPWLPATVEALRERHRDGMVIVHEKKP